MSLRLRYGLYWKGKYPPVLRPLFFVFVIWLLAATAYFSNWNILSLAQAHERISALESYEDMLLKCLNGKLRLIYDNNSGKGYGKTAILCRIEEIPL